VIGRDRELGVLRAALDAAATGGGAAVVAFERRSIRTESDGGE
jgi:hypothetical protein